MDFQRSILIAAIAAVSFMLLLEWNKFQQAQKPVSANAEQVQPLTPEAVTPTNSDIPTAPAANSGAPDAPSVATAQPVSACR